MADKESFSYAIDERGFETNELPKVPVILISQGRQIQLSGLVDTGASINVLPYRAGLALGAKWEQGGKPLELAGNLGRFEARTLQADAIIGDFDPVRLIFAWTRLESAPLILGQVNFFMEFKVCFDRTQFYFELERRE